MRSSNGGENSTAGEILLDVDINFDDMIFIGFDDDVGGDILPDLEIDPDDIFADFSFCSGGEGEESSGNSIAAGRTAGESSDLVVPVLVPDSNNKEERELSHNEVVSGRSSKEEEEEEEEDGSLLLVPAPSSSSGENRSAAGRKLLSTTAAATKGTSHIGKKKAKVDWTPELQRRFVQAVEQLGVDKAVPSRILQLMGIDCLTRHNIASHLQKYRSHRKHLLAREAEAASWSQRRHMYAAAGGVVMKSRPVLQDMKKPSWQAPPPPPHQIMRPLIRPLHVWGHPSVADRPQLVPVWPRHLTPQPQPWLPSRPPPPPVVGPPPPMPHDPNSFWHYSHYQMAPLTHGMPCFPPQLLPNMMFQAAHPAVPGVHPHPLFRPNNAAAAVSPMPTSEHSAALDAHPSNEKIDAAIGDVLAKPWSPLPLGLKPPSLESVMVELQRRGVGKVPP